MDLGFSGAERRTLDELQRELEDQRELAQNRQDLLYFYSCYSVLWILKFIPDPRICVPEIRVRIREVK
jgi:hypothetical protein